MTAYMEWTDANQPLVLAALFFVCCLAFSVAP